MVGSPKRRDSVRTGKNKRKFLAALEAGASISTAATAAGVAKCNMYDWRNASPEFREEWDEALETGTDKLEDELWRRGVEGVDKPVFQGGKQVGVIREYSDTCIIFTAKARRPEKFRDAHHHEISGRDGGPIETRQEINLSALTDEQLSALESIALAVTPTEDE